MKMTSLALAGGQKTTTLTKIARAAKSSPNPQTTRAQTPRTLSSRSTWRRWARRWRVGKVARRVRRLRGSGEHVAKLVLVVSALIARSALRAGKILNLSCIVASKSRRLSTSVGNFTFKKWAGSSLCLHWQQAISSIDVSPEQEILPKQARKHFNCLFWETQ